MTSITQLRDIIMNCQSSSQSALFIAANYKQILPNICRDKKVVNTAKLRPVLHLDHCEIRTGGSYSTKQTSAILS